MLIYLASSLNLKETSINISIFSGVSIGTSIIIFLLELLFRKKLYNRWIHNILSKKKQEINYENFVFHLIMLTRLIFLLISLSCSAIVTHFISKNFRGFSPFETEFIRNILITLGATIFFFYIIIWINTCCLISMEESALFFNFQEMFTVHNAEIENISIIEKQIDLVNKLTKNRKEIIQALCSFNNQLILWQLFLIVMFSSMILVNFSIFKFFGGWVVITLLFLILIDFLTYLIFKIYKKEEKFTDKIFSIYIGVFEYYKKIISAFFNIILIVILIFIQRIPFMIEEPENFIL